ncbi:MAG: hypothetical protein ACYCW6_14200 [Candidatus Xenobia bacterium]
MRRTATLLALLVLCLVLPAMAQETAPSVMGRIGQANRAWGQWFADFGPELGHIQPDERFDLVRQGHLVGQVKVVQVSALGVAVAHVSGEQPQTGDGLLVAALPPTFNQVLHDRYPTYRGLYATALRLAYAALSEKDVQDMPETHQEFLGGYRSFAALSRAIDDLNQAFPPPFDQYNIETGMVGAAYDPAYYDQTLAQANHDYAEAVTIYNTDDSEWAEVHTGALYH